MTEPTMPKIIKTFRSKMDQSVEYQVSVAETPDMKVKAISSMGLICNCPGFVYKGKCWHIEHCIALAAVKHGGQHPQMLEDYP